jgi:hypothetical protein
MSRLPQRLPIGDYFSGYLALVNQQHHVLSTLPFEHEAITIVEQGEWVVRYGVVYLLESYKSIVPELLAFDTGGGLSGEEAWDFLFNKSNLFPRTDILGYREDGTEDMLPIKKLDVMHPVRTFIYADETTRMPIAQIHALIAPNELTAPRILQSLPIYSQWEDLIK